MYKIHYPFPKLILLTLLPGMLTALAIFICLPTTSYLGLPPITAYLIPPAMVILPFQLGYLLGTNKQQTGHWGLDRVLAYRAPFPRVQYIVLVPLFTAWSLAIFSLMAPVETWMANNLFAWLPGVQYLTPSANNLPLHQYSHSTLTLVFLAGLLCFGILAPVTEEYYFRGHLLPAMEHFGNKAPMVNSALFAAYHLASPWHFPSLLVALLPPIWFSWRYKNVYITLWTQVMTNVIRLAIPLTAILLA